LFAINPLQIWYSNEARMYPLLVFLIMGATYFLWRAIELSKAKTKRPFLPMWVYVVLYFVLASLAVYTHYTAVFIIAIQSLFWVWVLWLNGFKKLLITTAVFATLIAIPLIPYTVPRIFKGYEANFSYVSPLTMLQDVYRFFAFGMTVDYSNALIQILFYMLLGLALLGLYAARPTYRQLFLLVYLLSVVVGLMAGSIFKPMYQGVRHIMAGSPAYLILVGWGLLFTIEKAKATDKAKRGAWVILSAASLSAILLSSTIAINNYYNNGSFGKKDLRDRVQLIEMLAGENDVVVYNDAVLLPLHDHYQKRTDVAFTASPIFGTSASQTAATQLTELAQKYDHIWFIPGAPADKRDETGMVQDWLDSRLMLIDTFVIESEAGNVETKLYATDAQTAVSNPTPLAEWQDLPTLNGYKLQSEQPISLPGIWVSLLWESDTKPNAAKGLQFQLRDKNGHYWAEHTTSIIQSNRNWRAKDPNQQSYLIPLDIGTPPGNYTLQAQPVQITNDGSLPLYDPIDLGTVEIAANNAWPIQPSWTTETSQLAFNNNFALQKLVFSDESVRPGHNLPLTLYWKTEAAQTGLRYELTVLDEDGDILRTQSNTPGAVWLDEWPTNTLFREDTGLYFPPETEPGTYSLHLALFQDDAPVAGRQFWQPWSSESNKIGEIRVESWPVETELPIDTIPLNAQFGSAIELHSYQLDQQDTSLELILYWHATAVPDKNLFTFVHLIDEDDNIVAQIDYVPVDGLRPTAGWRAGEVITDPYTLTLPSDLPTGQYQLLVGLFDPDTFERPLVTQYGEEQPNNQIVLTQLTLGENP